MSYGCCRVAYNACCIWICHMYDAHTEISQSSVHGAPVSARSAVSAIHMGELDISNAEISLNVIIAVCCELGSEHYYWEDQTQSSLLGLLYL